MWLRCLNAAFYKWNVKKRKPLYLYLRKADCVWLIQNITWIFFSFKALKLYCCFNVVIFFSIQNNNKFSTFWLFILGTCDSFSVCGIWAQFSRRTLSVINHPPHIGTFGILFVPYCNVFFKECTLLNNCWSHILFMIVFFFPSYIISSYSINHTFDIELWSQRTCNRLETCFGHCRLWTNLLLTINFT